MRKPDLNAMQFDELWQIHEELVKILSDRIVAEKRDLEKRLAQLNRVEIVRDPEGANPLPAADTTNAPYTTDPFASRHLGYPERLARLPRGAADLPQRIRLATTGRRLSMPRHLIRPSRQERIT